MWNSQRDRNAADSGVEAAVEEEADTAACTAAEATATLASDAADTAAVEEEAEADAGIRGEATEEAVGEEGNLPSAFIFYQHFL